MYLHVSGVDVVSNVVPTVLIGVVMVTTLFYNITCDI